MLVNNGILSLELGRKYIHFMLLRNDLPLLQVVLVLYLYMSGTTMQCDRLGGVGHGQYIDRPTLYEMYFLWAVSA